MMAEPAPLPAADLRRCVGPIEQARTLPAAAYTDPAVSAWERAVFFESCWMCVGRSDRLARPGDQAGVRVGDEPVLLTRDRAGQLRAFSNVCRHRGFELRPCDGSVTNSGVVRCGYHRWTYGLDGAFKGGPELSTTPGFDRGDPEHGLYALAAAEWGGWMFVHCGRDPEPLADHLGNLAELADPYDCAGLEVGASHDYVVEANWKLVIENYSECYHCSQIHPELCRISPPDSGANLTATGRWIGGSMRLEDDAETMSLDGRSGGAMLPGLDARQRREVLYLALFPNLLLSLHPDYVMTHRLQPLGPRRTRIECQWLFPQRPPGFDPAYAVDFWDLTNRQDWAACEGVQRGVAGRGYRQAPFAAAEVDVAAFVAYVAQAYLAGMPAPVTPPVANRWVASPG
jgi:glycine betaine catabolism A